MAAFNGCSGTVFTGESPEEFLGVKKWAFSKTAKNSDYADNTTGCATKTNVGATTTAGTIDFNLQDGVNKGKPPLEVKSEYEVEFHIDDTGDNYYSGTIIILELNDYAVDIENQELVSSSYSWKSQGDLLGNGTLASAGS